MKDLGEDEREEFRRTQKKMIDLALRVSGKKQFLSKNPPHTGRVKELLELYPNAKFVYLVRNPYTVYKSTMSFIGNTLKTTQLQAISREALERTPNFSTSTRPTRGLVLKDISSRSGSRISRRIRWPWRRRFTRLLISGISSP